LITVLPLTSFAKVSDFNALISDNMKSQTELHTTVRKNVEVARDEKNIREKVVVVDGTEGSYASPSRRDLLKFKKERVQHRPSETKQFERVAGEVSTADQ
jgi:hypothetical protein